LRLGLAPRLASDEAGLNARPDSGRLVPNRRTRTGVCLRFSGRVMPPFCRDIYEISLPRCQLGRATGARPPALPSTQSLGAASPRARGWTVQGRHGQMRRHQLRADRASRRWQQAGCPSGTWPALLCGAGRRRHRPRQRAQVVQPGGDPRQCRGQALSHGNRRRDVKTRNGGGPAAGAGVASAALRAASAAGSGALPHK
jgi:hypothetical protein